MFGKLRNLALAALLFVAGVGMTTASATASDCAPRYRYEWVLRHETRVVPYTVCETRYDHCGRPYQVEVTRYRTECVPVWKLEPVRY